MGCNCSSEVESDRGINDNAATADVERNSFRRRNQNSIIVNEPNRENIFVVENERRPVTHATQIQNKVNLGGNCSSEIENDRGVNDNEATANVNINNFRRNQNSIIVNKPNRTNYFITENEQSPITQSTQIDEFLPLKYRYFGPKLNFQGDFQGLNHELIGNLVFSGWRPQIQYVKPNFVNVPPNSQEGKAVINIFSKTSQNNSGTKLVLTEISRIENVFLYASYLLKKEEMQRRNGHVDELNLFHGTKVQNVESICNNNFDWRRYGDNIGNRFGKGVSFSPKAIYASHYCDVTPSKVMFLAKVLVAKAMVGDENMNIPIDTFFKKKRFNDTSVKYNLDVVVKYGDNEFYPAYKITFKIINNNSIST